MLENTINILQEYGQKFADVYKDKLLNHKASGNLLNSIQTKVVVNDTELILYMDLADYYYYIENGRGPGKFPPIDKILEWIRVKPILPREINGKLPTEKQLAFLIGRKIAREGFEGTHDLEDTKNLLQIEFELRIQEALIEDFKKEFEL